MTTDITPPPELAAKWVAEIYGDSVIPLHPITLRLVERAAQWGADQELEACCEVLQQKRLIGWSLLRSNRRPKTPSLKKQALKALEEIPIDPEAGILGSSLSTIRRALEALSDE